MGPNIFYYCLTDNEMTETDRDRLRLTVIWSNVYAQWTFKSLILQMTMDWLIKKLQYLPNYSACMYLKKSPIYNIILYHILYYNIKYGEIYISNI